MFKITRSVPPASQLGGMWIVDKTRMDLPVIIVNSVVDKEFVFHLSKCWPNYPSTGHFVKTITKCKCEVQLVLQTLTPFA